MIIYDQLKEQWDFICNPGKRTKERNSIGNLLYYYTISLIPIVITLLIALHFEGSFPGIQLTIFMGFVLFYFWVSIPVLILFEAWILHAIIKGALKNFRGAFSDTLSVAIHAACIPLLVAWIGTSFIAFDTITYQAILLLLNFVFILLSYGTLTSPNTKATERAVAHPKKRSALENSLIFLGILVVSVIVFYSAVSSLAVPYLDYLRKTEILTVISVFVIIGCAASLISHRKKTPYRQALFPISIAWLLVSLFILIAYSLLYLQ
jgi:hypothetical protein